MPVPALRGGVAMTARILAIACLLACWSTHAAAQKLVTFAKGTAEVVLPQTFVTTEQNDGTLRAVFGPGGSHRLELGVRDAKARDGAANAGEVIVRGEALRKSQKLFELPGRVAFMEAVPDRKEDDRVMRTAVWYIGAGNSVFVMTLTAPLEESPELTRFLGKPLNDAIASVRRRRP